MGMLMPGRPAPLVGTVFLARLRSLTSFSANVNFDWCSIKGAVHGRRWKENRFGPAVGEHLAESALKFRAIDR